MILINDYTLIDKGNHDEEGIIEKAFTKVKAVDNPGQMLELLG